MPIEIPLCEHVLRSMLPAAGRRGCYGVRLFLHLYCSSKPGQQGRKPALLVYPTSFSIFYPALNSFQDCLLHRIFSLDANPNLRNLLLLSSLRFNFVGKLC